jgi:hypothetical protein
MIPHYKSTRVARECSYAMEANEKLRHFRKLKKDAEERNDQLEKVDCSHYDFNLLLHAACQNMSISDDHREMYSNHGEFYLDGVLVRRREDR